MRNKMFLIASVALLLSAFMSSFVQGANLKEVEDLYQMNQFPKAIVLLRKQIDQDKNNIAAHRYLIKCYNKLKKTNDILTEYNTLSVKEPSNAIYKFAIGYIYDLEGNPIGARRGYEEALSLNPKLPFVYYNLGWIYDDQGEINTAIEYYEKEIKYNPSNLDAYYNLAKDYLKKKNYSKVISTTQKMLEVSPGDIRAYDTLGWAYYDQGSIDDALQAWQKTVNLSPQDIEAGKYNIDGIILDSKGLHNSAMRELLKGIKQNSGNARLHNNLGLAYMHKISSQTFGKKNDKWLNEAIKEFKQSLQINPKYTNAYLSLGDAYFKLGRNLDGLKQYETYVKLRPNDVTGLNILGTAYKEVGRYEDAKNIFNKAIDISPKDSTAYANLGTVYYYQGLQDAAVAQWQKSLELNPYQPLLKERLETAFKKTQ
jgi:tetratricopeptide (TPR) repeat protein